MQLGARHRRSHQGGLARFIHTVHGKHVLGKIDTNEDNAHDFPPHRWLMETNTSHRGTWMPYCATQRAPRDGEVPFIR